MLDTVGGACNVSVHEIRKIPALISACVLVRRERGETLNMVNNPGVVHGKVSAMHRGEVRGGKGDLEHVLGKGRSFE